MDPEYLLYNPPYCDEDECGGGGGGGNIPDPTGEPIGSIPQLVYTVEPNSEITLVAVSGVGNADGGLWRLVFADPNVPEFTFYSDYMGATDSASEIEEVIRAMFPVPYFISFMEGDMSEGVRISWAPGFLESLPEPRQDSLTAYISVEQSEDEPFTGPDAPYTLFVDQLNPGTPGVIAVEWATLENYQIPSIQLVGQAGVDILGFEIQLLSDSSSSVRLDDNGIDFTTPEAITINADTEIVISATAGNIEMTTFQNNINLLSSDAVSINAQSSANLTGRGGNHGFFVSPNDPTTVQVSTDDVDGIVRIEASGVQIAGQVTMTTGDIVFEPAKGIILEAPDGTLFRVTVEDDGSLTTTSV